MSPPASPTDWRRQGQERYLRGATWSFQPYRPPRVDWDHDHCEFCSDKFSLAPGDLRAGYTTSNGAHWVCESCFADFRDELSWNLAPSRADSQP